MARYRDHARLFSLSPLNDILVLSLTRLAINETSLKSNVPFVLANYREFIRNSDLSAPTIKSLMLACRFFSKGSQIGFDLPSAACPT